MYVLPHPHQQYKPQSGRYVAITLQGMLSHTTQDDEKLLHFQINQPLGMVSMKSDYI